MKAALIVVSMLLLPGAGTAAIIDVGSVEPSVMSSSGEGARLRAVGVLRGTDAAGECWDRFRKVPMLPFSSFGREPPWDAISAPLRPMVADVPYDIDGDGVGEYVVLGGINAPGSYAVAASYLLVVGPSALDHLAPETMIEQFEDIYRSPDSSIATLSFLESEEILGFLPDTSSDAALGQAYVELGMIRGTPVFRAIAMERTPYQPAGVMTNRAASAGASSGEPAYEVIFRIAPGSLDNGSPKMEILCWRASWFGPQITIP